MRTDVYIEVSSMAPKKSIKRYGYVLTAEGFTATRERFQKFVGSYHETSLQAVLDALNRFKDGKRCEICIHLQDEYIKSAYENYLKGWQQNGYISKKGTPISDREKWRRIWEISQKHLIWFETGRNEFTDWILREIERRK